MQSFWTPGSARGDGDTSVPSVPVVLQLAALLESCQACFFCKEELNNALEVFFSGYLCCLLSNCMVMVPGDGEGQKPAQRDCEGFIMVSEL